MQAHADARLECRICWYVYDPARGDPVWQIEPGTPFAELPPHWSCPQCAAEKSGFIAVAEPMNEANDAERITERVRRAFALVQATRMGGLPFVNARLRVELIGLRRWQGLWLGVLLTPWFLSLLLPPEGGAAAWPQLRPGESARFAFPAGEFEFIAGREGEAGEYLACSLFSPVFEFAEHEVARQTALACLQGLFEDASAHSRSDFLRGAHLRSRAGGPG